VCGPSNGGVFNVLERTFNDLKTRHDLRLNISELTANLLTLNSSETVCLLNGLKQQLYKIQDCSLTTTHSARNPGFIFDEHLAFSDQITALSKSLYYHIRKLRCIRPYLEFKTASNIATCIVRSKLDYCNCI